MKYYDIYSTSLLISAVVVVTRELLIPIEVLIWVLLALSEGVWISSSLCWVIRTPLGLAWSEIWAELVKLEGALSYISVSSGCLLVVSCLGSVPCCGLGWIYTLVWVLFSLLLVSSLLIFGGLLLESGSRTLRSGAAWTIALILLLLLLVWAVLSSSCGCIRAHHGRIGNLPMMMLLFHSLFSLLLLH